MNKADLIQSAATLQPPQPASVKEYADQRESLPAELSRVLRERDDINALIGPENLAMMEDNHRNHVRFMVSLFAAYSPEVLVDTVIWVFRAYRSHGFSLAYWPAQLDTWLEIMRTSLSPKAYEEIAPFYVWMLVNQASFAALSDELLQHPEGM